MQGRAGRRGNGLWLSSPALVMTMTSPFSTSRMNSAPTMSSAQVSEATTYASPRRPSTSGRMPTGSRAAIIMSLVRATSDQAPSICRVASTKRSTMRRFFERESRCRMTSVSEVEGKMAPVLISSSRSVRALVRLPLWATAKPPVSMSA